MKKLTTHDAMIELAKALGKPCMYIGGWDNSPHVILAPDEILKAAPYLNLEDGQILLDGQAILVFDTDDEMWDAYERTVGDYGPTKLNPYNGPARVYALTCNADGTLGAENT